MYVEVKTLSPVLVDALKSVEYHRADIEVQPVEELSLQIWGNDGARGFATLVNMTTGDRKTMLGSWGGPNMFTTSTVDSDEKAYQLPPNGVVIKGQRGYPRTYATLYAHPSALGKYLPAGSEEQLTEAEQRALYCYVQGGAYRRDALRRMKVSQETVQGLVDRGYLKANKAGSISITTKGKNAKDGKQYYS